VLFPHEALKKLCKIRQLRVVKAPRGAGGMWAQDCDMRARVLALPVRGCVRIVHRLFKEENGVILCEAGEQVLGTLVYKVPTQVRKNNERKH